MAIVLQTTKFLSPEPLVYASRFRLFQLCVIASLHELNHRLRNILRFVVHIFQGYFPS